MILQLGTSLNVLEVHDSFTPRHDDLPIRITRRGSVKEWAFLPRERVIELRDHLNKLLEKP